MADVATGSILVVDDDPNNRDLLARRLARRGYSVEAAADGPSALAYLDAHFPDLVLLDWQMPGMSGLDVLQAIRAKLPSARLPVLMVTAKSQTADIVAALELGADDYITKPIDFPVTLARIHTQLSRKFAQDQLRESEERYALAAEGANDGLWDWKIATNEIYFSPRWKDIVGCRSDEIGCHPQEWFSRVHPDDLLLVRGNLDRHLAGTTPHFETEHRMRHKSGAFRWVLTRGLAVRNHEGVVTRIAGSQADITEGKVLDVLTGLPNRVLLADRIERLLRHRAARGHSDAEFAVLLMDLDQFKVVNDSLGHHLGDELLQAVARRLEASLRSTDTISRTASGGNPAGLEHTLARLGGDEFIILLNDVLSVTDATRVAERVHTALANPFQLAERDVFITVSIGIAASASGYATTEDILRDADTAMNRAKALGKGRSEVFDAAMGAEAVERLRLESELRLAVRQHEFLPYFQPIVDLRTGRLAGFEALLRWHHPERGILPPAEFLQLVEENGLLLPIGRRFYEDVCQQHRRWLDAYPDAARLSVNINFASGQLLESGLAERLLRILNEARLESRHIVVEITESTAIRDFAQTSHALQELREAGIKVVLDDFGTGYSSLACLHRLPISGLKLDRSFIRAADDHAELIRAVLGLSDSLGLTVTAEGIETTAQYERLSRLGCHFGQGYWFARPLSSGAAAEFISADRIFEPTLCTAL